MTKPAGRQTLLIDGQSSGSKTGSAGFQGDSKLFLARWQDADTADHFFNGTIYEIRVWHTARSDSEIQNNRQCYLSGAESGLFAHWVFDRDPRRELTDRTRK